MSWERVAGGGSLGDGLGSAGGYPRREELANRAMRRFSSVKPWPGGLSALGDFVPLRRSAVLIGGGGRLPPVTFKGATSGASLTMGEY